jgi:hypothetical protein
VRSSTPPLYPMDTFKDSIFFKLYVITLKLYEIMVPTVMNIKTVVFWVVMVHSLTDIYQTTHLYIPVDCSLNS